MIYTHASNSYSRHHTVDLVCTYMYVYLVRQTKYKHITTSHCRHRCCLDYDVTYRVDETDGEEEILNTPAYVSFLSYSTYITYIRIYYIKREKRTSASNFINKPDLC